MQNIGDIPGEIGESGEDNGRKSAETAGHHRHDIQRVPEHSYAGCTACGYSGTNGGRPEGLSLPD